MLGLSQSELDAVTAVLDQPDNGCHIDCSQEESGLDKELVQRKKTRGVRNAEVAKQGLSQEDLDALNCDGNSNSDCEASEEDMELDDKLVAKKKSRKVSFSGVKSELTSLACTEHRAQGLPQSSLDNLGVSEESYTGREDFEGADAALRSCKRKRLSVGDGVTGAMVRASELLGSSCKVTGGMSQQQLDEFSVASDLHDSETVDPEEASSYALRTKRRLAAARRGESEPMAEPPPGYESVKQAEPGSFLPAPVVAAEDVENAVCSNKEPRKDLDLGIGETYPAASQSLVSPKRRSFAGYPLSPVKLN
jgi:hypothetical protein